MEEDIPGPKIDDSPPEHVDDFTNKSHYPDEVSEQWDEIRAGEHVAVDERGNIVDNLNDAHRVLHPSYGMASLPGALTGMRPGDLPPVTSHLVGKPDEIPEHTPCFEWIDRETGHFMRCIITSDGERIDSVGKAFRTE